MKDPRKITLIMAIFLICIIVAIVAKLNNFQIGEGSLVASGYVFALISIIAIIVAYIYAKHFLQNGWRRSLIFSAGFFTIAAHIAKYADSILSNDFEGFNLGILHFVVGAILSSTIFFIGGIITNKKIFADRKMLLLKAIIGILVFNALLIIIEIISIDQLFDLYVVGKGITKVGKLAIGLMAISLYATAAVYFFNKYIKSYSKEMMLITLGFILLGSAALSFFFVEKIGDLMGWLGRAFALLAFIVFILSVRNSD